MQFDTTTNETPTTHPSAGEYLLAPMAWGQGAVMNPLREDAAPSRYTFQSTQEGVGWVEITGICLALAESCPAVEGELVPVLPDGTHCPTVRYSIGIYRVFDAGHPGYLGVVTKQTRDNPTHVPPFALVRASASIDDLMAWVKGVNPSYGVRWRPEVPSPKWDATKIERFKQDNHKDRIREFRQWERALVDVTNQIGISPDQSPTYTLGASTQLQLETRAARESISPAQLLESILSHALREGGGR